MRSENKTEEKAIGYLEVFYYDEDDNDKYRIRYYADEDEAREDFMSRSYAGDGDHNLCCMVGHGPSFRHICLERTIFHYLVDFPTIEESNLFKEWSTD